MDTRHIKRSFAGAPAIAEQSHVYVGRRCLQGHDGLRYKVSRSCVHCSRERALAKWRAGQEQRNREADIDELFMMQKGAKVTRL